MAKLRKVWVWCTNRGCNRLDQASNNGRKNVKCIEIGEIFDSIVQVGKKHNQYASNVSRYYIDGKRKLGGYTYEKIN